MTLFEILSHDERVIVFSNEGECIIITWNRSLTLQRWMYTLAETWDEVDCRTLSDEPKNFEQARKKAQAWFGDYLAQSE